MMKSAIRKQKGISGLVIVTMSAFMIILPLGLLAYEFLRFSLVQQELRSVADASALAGAVGIATSGVGNTLWQQEGQAMSAAYNAFCENSVTDCVFVPVGQSGANVNETESSSVSQPAHFNNSTPWTGVAAHTAQVNFVLVDTNGNQTNWQSGSGPSQSNLTSATSLRVDAYYGYALPILGELGIGPFTMVASSTGGLPQLDVILCFDMSGSMDDFTNTTFLNRYWVDTRNGTLAGSVLSGFCAAAGLNSATFSGGCVEYDIPASNGTYSANSPYWTSGSDGSASGPLYYTTGCNQVAAASNGTTVNVQPPMNLNQESACPVKFQFMAQQRNSGPGNPPGNYSSSAPTAGLTSSAIGLPCYTDLVVNVNGNAHWLPVAPASYNSKNFNDVAWAAEASRGNLETATLLTTAINPLSGTPSDNKYFYIIKDASGTYHYTGSFSSIAAGGQPGSQLAYWSYVQNNTHPLYDAVTAANNFFTFLYGSADCHLGLICFSDGIGNGPTDTWADGWQSPPGGAQINGWTTASVGGASGTPPPSANIAGLYTGGSTMGVLSSPGDPDNGIDTLGGNGTFLLPLIKLSPTADNYSTGSPVNNYMTVGSGTIGAGNNIVATGSTDITDALKEAVRELTPGNNLTRANATRAIVLFTDGSPDIDASALPPNANFNTCVSDCGKQATNAYTTNPPITVFSIGLAMDPTMVTNQSTLLTTITNNANGGTAGQSNWQQITSASQVNNAFESIAKNLVVITK